jgi:hypothetical protein
MAASHGASVIRMPPTKITAGVSETNAMQLTLQMAEAGDDSFIFQHSSKPFTSQHNILDFTADSHKQSSSVIHKRRSTQVALEQQNARCIPISLAYTYLTR